jgi:hypothetical protein
MPALFIFLLKVNAALLIFCAGYYFVLRRLTFYTLNRIDLVLAIVFASVYPKIDISGFAQRHREMQPVSNIVYKLRAPAKALVAPLSRPDYWALAEGIFWLGVVLLSVRLTAQLCSLFKIYRNSRPERILGHDVRVLDNDAAPFSFWKSIYVNPAKHEPADLRSILLHEQVHVSEWHTLDIILAELSTIFYWFNPGVWLMKKAIRENIEFITDRKILQNGTDTKQYQYSLVNVSFSAAPQGIVNHFNISTIKKRIIMMNAKRSSKFKLTHYAFLVPAVIALLFTVSNAALVKKSKGLYKALHFTITNAVKPDLSKNKTDSKYVKTEAAITVKTNKPATAKLDTLKNGKFFLSTTGRTDSLNYVINGKKATKADFLALNPDNIMSIDMATAERGSKIMNNLDKSHEVLFVTTNDSEAGKKFKDKVDGLERNLNLTMTGSGYTSGTGNKASNVVVIDGVSTGTGSTFSYSGSAGNLTLDSTNMAPIKVEAFTTVSGNSYAPGTIRLSKAYKNYTIAKGFKGNLVSGKMLIIDTVRDGKKIKMLNGLPVIDTIIVNGGKGPTMLSFNRDKSFKPMTYTTSKVNTFFPDGATVSLNHLADKMIIINGKIATEADLKKLSAFDIDRMTLKTDEETKELYGDKAKNGIVFIVTKRK